MALLVTGRLGARDGNLGEFVLGATDTVGAVEASGLVRALGTAVVALSVTALGVVTTSGSIRQPAGGLVATRGSIAAATVSHAAIRVTQEVAEIIYEQPAFAAVRLTQEVAEVVWEQVTPKANIRLTQAVLEVVIEGYPFADGQARCSGSATVTGHLVATAQGWASASGKITSAVAVPVSARGRATAFGQALLTIARVGLIGQAGAQGAIAAALGAVSRGRATAQGKITATVAIVATAVGLVRGAGSMPQGYVSVAARGVVATRGYAVIGINGSGPSCLTGKDSTGAAIPNFVY